MYVITRNKFLDIPLGPDGVAAWFEGWLGWRAIAIRKNVGARGLDGRFHVECTITGYPQGELAGKADEWNRALSKQWFEGAEFGKEDSIVIRSIAQPIGPQPLIEIVTGLFNGLAESMAVMIELITWSGGTISSDTPQQALVLYGLMENGVFVVKAVWPKALPHDDGSISKPAVWPGEASAVEALNQFLTFRQGMFKGPEASETFAAATYERLDEGVKTVFSPMAAQQGALFVKIIFGGTQLKENFGHFLKRTLGLAGVTALLIWAWTVDGLRMLRYVSLTTALFTGIAFVVAVGWKGFIIWMFRKEMRKGFKRIYTEPWGGREVADAEQIFGGIPSFRKLSDDAVALGGQHVIDLNVTNNPGVNVTRVYFYRESRTYLYMVFLMENPDAGKNFPASSTFLARTLYTNGVVAATIDQGLGFKKRLDRHSCSKMLVGITTVEEMLKRHASVVSKFVTREEGPLAFSKEELIRREISDHEKISQLNRKHGYYTWIEAFGEAFGWVRRDYKEDRRQPPGFRRTVAEH